MNITTLFKNKTGGLWAGTEKTDYLYLIKKIV